MKHPKNLSGIKFGRLTVVERAEKDYGRSSVWKCLCYCGKYTKVSRRDLVSGHTSSCGCGRIKFGFIPWFSDMYGNLKRGAAKRSLQFLLSFEEFMSLTLKNCEYCGEEPEERVYIRNGKSGISYNANGIDRLDSLKDYTLDNCVPCCYQCNTMKLDYSLEEFKSKIIKIALHKGWI